MIQFNYLRIYLDIDTVSRRLLPRMAMMDMDGNLTTSFAPITFFKVILNRTIAR